MLNMLTEILHSYAPAGLAVALIFTTTSEVFYPAAIASIYRFTRHRKAFLSLSLLSSLAFGARATEVIFRSRHVPDGVLVYTISQILLQITIFLTLLTSSADSPRPYWVTWLLSLLVEIAGISNLIIYDPGIEKVYLSISMIAIGILVLLSFGAATCLWTSADTDHQSERQSLLGKSKASSETSSLLHNSSQCSAKDTNSILSEEDLGMTKGFSESEEIDGDSDDDDKSIKAIRAKKLQQPGGFIAYCASWKILLPFIIPTKSLRLQFYMVGLLLSMLLERALVLVSPFLLGRIVDKLTRTHEFPVFDIIAYVVIVMFTSDVCGLTGVNDALLGRIGAWSRQTLVVAAFDRIMSLSADFHDSKDSGEVIKAIEQAESLHELFETVVLDLLPGVLDLIIAMYYVNYLLDVYATLIVVAVGIGFYFGTVFASRPVNSSKRVGAAAERTESEVLYEAVGNWAIVSYFNRKLYEVARISKAAQSVSTANVRNLNFRLMMFSLQEISERLGLVAILLLAAYRISKGTSTIGTFVSVERYWEVLQRPLYNLGHTYRQTASHLIDAERLLQLFETEIKVKDLADARTLRLEKGKIEFSNVDFTYGSSRKVIQDLSFTIQPGQTVALVGPTGGGKSTITKLLMRFYDVDDGKILLDDQDISTVTQDSLRNCFGFVPQDSVLFNTTIIENVRYGRLDATDEEVFAACKAACIHDRIMSLPSGYHTRVGERGVKMSGGERQRVAIARVLLKHPWIVVLDEATSAMDSQTESEIQKALRNLTKGRSSIIVAHRLSTIVDADVILLIDQGHIIEQGTHDELLQSHGRYSQLWEKQITAKVTHAPDESIDED